MATITPKEKDGKIIAYKFRACVGRDENGRQVSRATTWQVPENLSMVQLEKPSNSHYKNVDITFIRDII